MSRPALLALLITLNPLSALAQAGGDASAPPPPPPPDQGMAPPPAEAAPTEAPPAPEAQPSPGGQWVNTEQYGWIWIPYGKQYTYVPEDQQVFPDEYVYYPVYGWRWVVAPWVYGYGPVPYWGPLGLSLYLWWAHPWFRVGGYWGWGYWHGWGGYRGWVGPRVWGARGWAKAPAYYRTGVGGPHPGRFRTAPGHWHH